MSKANASPPTRSAPPAMRRCGRCSARMASRTPISRQWRPISPTCRRCSTAVRSMIGTLPQFLKQLRSEPNKYRVLFTARDAVGPTQPVMWSMRADVIAAHRPELVDFFEDHIRAVRWFIDPTNREAALELLASVTKLPKEELEFAFTKDDFYHSPDARPALASAQREIEEHE